MQNLDVKLKGREQLCRNFQEKVLVVHSFFSTCDGQEVHF
jgi:hypothetical protein